MEAPVTKDLRLRMVEHREGMGLSRAEMGELLGISAFLLRIIEEGGVTQPAFAKRIAVVYGFSDLEVEDLMPRHHREHGGCYDPDLYTRGDAFSSNYNSVHPTYYANSFAAN